MALKKKSVTGMKDILPQEMVIRDYLMQIIKETYRGYGFSSIETPAVESIDNLLSKQGGDNEKLIFKVLKRGEKLKLEEAKEENDLVDSGLRYDLTLPLARYYSNNLATLPSPFKALQIGSVWRADRPQKGRYRQFTQCDIDILGEEGNIAEIELMLATTTALSKLCPKNHFTVRVNDRKILKSMALFAGFKDEDTDSVFITLDKMDKIGIEKVKEELVSLGLGEETSQKYIDIFNVLGNDENALLSLKEKLAGFIKEEDIDNLYDIITSVKKCKTTNFDIIFDPTLVRGMGYYTGTIFEVSMEGFSGSVAAGGRYDKMIGKFTGNDTPACGFSIGFERIVLILMEQGFKVENLGTKKAYLYEKNMDMDKVSDIISEANKERLNGNIILVSKMNKNKKFQKKQLEEQGYEEIVEFYNDKLKL